jgi:hypothetical protein
MATMVATSRKSPVSMLKRNWSSPVAAALVDRLVADAREQGFMIIPFCPYVRARYVRNPDWQDVMIVAPGEVPKPCTDNAVVVESVSACDGLSRLGASRGAAARAVRD